MTNPTKHPASISDLMDAGLADAAWRSKATTAPWEPTPTAQAPVEADTRPEGYLSKQAVAAHYAMSVRWVEQRISDGLPVADYMEKRPRFRLSETEPWLREHGHLSGERPKAPRPGTKAVS